MPAHVITNSSFKDGYKNKKNAIVPFVNTQCHQHALKIGVDGSLEQLFYSSTSP